MRCGWDLFHNHGPRTAGVCEAPPAARWKVEVGWIYSIVWLVANALRLVFQTQPRSSVGRFMAPIRVQTLEFWTAAVHDTSVQTQALDQFMAVGGSVGT